MKRSLIKYSLPPFLLDFASLVLKRSIRLSGEYETWEQAKTASTGYETPEILDRVCAAMRAVKSGAARYERDSVLFNEIALPFPVIAALLATALEKEGRLSVLDFGGALGSTYVQSKDFLTPIRWLRWAVVEQPHFVAVGQQEFADDVLRFYPSIAAAWDAEKPDAVLLSAVLQYMPYPYKVLSEVMGYSPRCVVIDRTPINRNNREILAVQRVPSAIVSVSYPVWLFSKRSLIAPFATHYDLRTEFDAVDGTLGVGRHRSDFKGFIFMRRAH